MATIVIELTNHCNLRCNHCFDNRHSADGNLKIEIIEKILSGAKDHGFDNISFTGGEPTLHPEFIEILGMVFDAGLKCGFVTNGWNFPEIYKGILPYRDRLSIITFSLDGAKEETHDRSRGKGSYRRLMKAFSVCVIMDIPFTINTIIKSYNLDELKELTELATKLGSHGLRFGHLLPNPHNIGSGMDLSSDERREAESLIRQMQKDCQMLIVIAPGYYTHNLFPCDPLKMKEFNVDWHGNVTICCHLSGHGDGVGKGDVIANLEVVSFAEAYKRLIEFTMGFRKEKLEHNKTGNFEDSDNFPCCYCFNYFKKVDWLKACPETPWASQIWAK